MRGVYLPTKSLHFAGPRGRTVGASLVEWWSLPAVAARTRLAAQMNHTPARET